MLAFIGARIIFAVALYVNGKCEVAGTFKLVLVYLSV